MSAEQLHSISAGREGKQFDDDEATCSPPGRRLPGCSSLPLASLTPAFARRLIRSTSIAPSQQLPSLAQSRLCSITDVRTSERDTRPSVDARLLLRYCTSAPPPPELRRRPVSTTLAAPLPALVTPYSLHLRSSLHRILDLSSLTVLPHFHRPDSPSSTYSRPFPGGVHKLYRYTRLR